MGESSIYPDSASSPGNDSNDALHVNSDPLNNDSASHEFNCDPGGKNFSKSSKNIDSLNVIAVNVCGIECSGRLEEIRLLLVKYKVDIAIISEIETSHSFAATTDIEGFKPFCPPTSVTGPSGKEAGVIVMVS